jgi:predicted O-linked N-acetylglucosamine transferase (SPINDLY family)
MFAAAVAHHEAGRLAEARSGYRDIVARDPDHAESLHLLGLIMAQTGEPEAGAQLIDRAITLTPGRAPHHNSLAIAYRGMGRDEDAIREYRAAAALRPESAEIRNNLAATLEVLGQREAAVEEYRRAAGIAPEMAEIWYNLGNALSEPAETEACFRRAIALRPDFVNALANYGRWLIAQARWRDAEALLGTAVRLAPNDAHAWNNLGVARQELGQAAAAEASFRRAVGLDPHCADAHYNLGCALSADGRTDEAVASHLAALAADPLHGAARLAACMARVPILCRTQAEVADRRADYLAALTQLASETDIPGLAAAIGSSQPFFLPYQGENDREPQCVYGRMVCRLLAGTILPTPRPRQRIRVGIVSGFFRDHTIFKLFLEGWLTELDRARFEITAFHTSPIHDAVTRRAAELCDRFVHGSAPAPGEMDVLLYPEVGMDPIAGRLAAQRLARVQCVAWGHPVTTGMPTMDFFLSSALMEPPDADAHYTERLIRLPGLGVHYTPDEPPPPSLEQKSSVVFWSGQALYKYLPRYDTIFPRIAIAVGACRFLFIAFANSAAVTEAFNERLRRAFAAFNLDAKEYCEILPPMPQDRFVAAVGMADVVLDTPGWSGGKSTLDSLAQHPAIVTLPGRFMRGRHTAAILRHIGCETTIASSIDDYVSIAARLALDIGWRTQVRHAMAERGHHAFRDTAPIRALEDFLERQILPGGTIHRVNELNIGGIQ